MASQQAESAHLQSLVLQLQEQVAGLTQTSTVATNTSFLGQEQTTSAVAELQKLPAFHRFGDGADAPDPAGDAPLLTGAADEPNGKATETSMHRAGQEPTPADVGSALREEQQAPQARGGSTGRRAVVHPVRSPAKVRCVRDTIWHTLKR